MEAVVSRLTMRVQMNFPLIREAAESQDTMIPGGGQRVAEKTSDPIDRNQGKEKRTRLLRETRRPPSALGRIKKVTASLWREIP